MSEIDENNVDTEVVDPSDDAAEVVVDRAEEADDVNDVSASSVEENIADGDQVPDSEEEIDQDQNLEGED